MRTIFELISREISAEAKDRGKPKVETLTAGIASRSEKLHDKYEAEVFNFLLANRDGLGIKSVMKFTNHLVDGAVELSDSRRLTVEIKFRMNWEKACQAEYQFRNFLRRHGKEIPVDGGLVIFEEFSGDWQRQPACRQVQNGWNFWYMAHSKVDDLRLDLLRLRNRELEGFPG